MITPAFGSLHLFHLMGASGGTFDGENLPVAPIDTAFGGADDADIMSFDGLFLRAEIGY